MPSLDVDLLIPAAIEGGIHAGNAERVRAKVIVEGAHGPTTPEADAILQSRGSLVVPDILANAGGVRHDLPLRTAAACLAVERVAQAHLLRGLYP